MIKNVTLHIILMVFVLTRCAYHQDDTYVGNLPDKIDFNFHIKPILSDRCYACHGPDAAARKGNIRLDDEAFAFSLLDSLKDNYVIKPGDLDRSELFQRITSTNLEQRMPPEESNLSLSNYEIALLKNWIEQGAEWKPHWSFIQPEKTTMPEVKQSDWPQNSIDFFILNKLELLDSQPSIKASMEKLIRRVSFDLTGLPPSTEHIDLFLVNKSNDAFEQIVDELLASDAYGERMASEWMDLARYAETNGIHHDLERNMWPWRDWVIDALNNNMGYDQFVTWQLAGDLFDEPTYEQQLATAFNRNNRTTQECGSLDEEFRVSYVIDRTNTFGKAFLGLTVACAQCHDHKYDPISQKEYYQLSAFFNQVPEKGVTQSFSKTFNYNQQSAPYLELPEEDVKEIREHIDGLIAAEYKNGSMQDKDEVYRANWEEELEAMLQPVMIMKDTDTLRPTFILNRGVYDAHGDTVSHGTPESIFAFRSKFSSSRLGLAQWLFSPENPLTARVAVNRFWQMIFGSGLVDTPDDFGSQGSLPTHPELLDWLAVEFIESGWDVKHLLKLMVLSSTYQQSTKTDSIQLAFDRDNKWLGRGTQQRLSAEMIRDQALKISGLLHEKVGGPSVKPYQPSGLWLQVSSGGRYARKYMNAHGEDLYRRSLYTYWKRILPPPSMMIFDAGSRNLCTVKRQSTNTPLQALVLLNDPQFIISAQALAKRMIEEGGDNSKDRITYAFYLATSRKPDLEEINILEDLFQTEMDEFKKHPSRADEFLQIGAEGQDATSNKLELAAYGVVANAIMNLSESIQKN